MFETDEVGLARITDEELEAAASVLTRFIQDRGRARKASGLYLADLLRDDWWVWLDDGELASAVRVILDFQHERKRELSHSRRSKMNIRPDMVLMLTNKEATKFLGQYGYKVEVTEDPIKRFKVIHKQMGDSIGRFSQFELEILCQGVYIAWVHMTSHLNGLRPPER